MKISCCAGLSLLMTTAVVANAGMTISTTRDGDLYYRGEQVTFSIASDLTNGAVRAYKLYSDLYTIVKSGSITANASGAATVTYTVTNSCFLQLNVDYNNNNYTSGSSSGAAACEPWNIIPENPPPSDLASFWNGKKAALDALPANAVITYLPAESDTAIDVYSYEVNAGGGTIGTQDGVKAYGYFAKPKGAGPFPAIMIFYGAATYSVGTGDPKAWARKGALAFNMNPHPLMTGQPAAYYDSYKTNELNNYRIYGRTNRETSYFLGMFSRCYVEARYLISRLEWDHQHLVMQGFSQGGGQAIAASYLVPETTALVAVCPALNDHAARIYSRKPGWPSWVTYSGTTPTDTNMLTASKYYDGVNFTALMSENVRGHFSAGFIDGTCAPGTVYAAYNNFNGRKEMLHLLNIAHSDSQPLYINDSDMVIQEELGVNYSSVDRQLLVDCMENNPTNISRWNALNCTLSGSTTAYEGLSSLKMVCPAGTNNAAILLKNMDLTYYAANNGFLEYVIRGDATNAVDWGAVKIGFVSASGGALIQPTPILIGQSTSWTLVSQPLSGFQIMNGGNPQWDDITSIRIYDGDVRAGSFSIDKIRIVEGAANLPPYFVNNPFLKPDATNGMAYSQPINGQAIDPEGGTKTFSKIAGPEWLSITGATVQGTPGSVDVGTNSFMVQVTDNGGLSDTAMMTINVVAGTSPQTVTFTSIGAEDGHITESSETSNVGGTIKVDDAASAGLRVGEMGTKAQVKTIVSFDTSSIPDGAVIQSATLKMRQGTLYGAVTNLGLIKVDINGGAGFNNSAALEIADFQAPADAVGVATMSIPATNGTWSTGSLNATGLTYVNKTGRTQLRVYFEIDDDNDSTSDYLGFNPGEFSSAIYRPVLEVIYQ